MIETKKQQDQDRVIFGLVPESNENFLQAKPTNDFILTCCQGRESALLTLRANIKDH